MNKSLIEYAYEFVSAQNSPVGFAKIWEYVKKEANLSEEEAARKAGQFFTNMMLDGRFVTLGENEWDLRSRQTFDKVHIDMNAVYSEVETTDDDEEEEEEEKIYNQAFEEPKLDDDSDKSSDESDGGESDEESTEF